MKLPKSEIYTILKTLETSETISNIKVYQEQPQVFKTLPVVTFSLSNMIPQYSIDNDLIFQNITITIDIWGNNSKQCSDILEMVETLMRNNYYRMTSAYDVPNLDDKVRHVVCRFEQIF